MLLVSFIICGHSTGAGHLDFDRNNFKHILVRFSVAQSLFQHPSNTIDGHRVVAEVFLLTDEAALKETLSDCDVFRVPVLFSVHSETATQKKQLRM